jgi:urea transport system ATP-binding protein
MLTVERVDTYYGETRILKAVSLTIEPGEIVAVLGRNGAGKSTLLRSIMGLTPPRAGRILFKKGDITRLPTYAIAALGIGYVPQGKHIFPRLSVADNLRLGALMQRSATKVIPRELFEYFPILDERLAQLGGSLSGGEQQMLALARGLAGDPGLLLLDEPSESLQPSLVESIKTIVQRVRRERTVPILLVEQNLDFARALADRYYVLDNGLVVLEGDMRELTSEEVIKQHLSV